MGGGASGMATLTGLLPGLAISFAGFIGLALVQIGRAAVDTAEYTQQMLQIARDQLQVSKQGLNQGKALEEGLAALKSAPEEKSVASFADAKLDTSPAMAPASASESKPALEEFFHKGEYVQLKNNVLNFGGETFGTEIEARQYIDELEARRAAPALSIGASATPDPDRVALGLEDGELEYSGRKIQVKNGKFLTATRAFSSLEAVQKYLDQLGVNPNATLGGVRR